jgi:hypothetical protein
VHIASKAETEASKGVRVHGGHPLIRCSVVLPPQDPMRQTQLAVGVRAVQKIWSNRWTGHETIRTHDPLFSSSIHPSHQDSLLYNHFSRTHPSSISSSIHCGVHLSLYLNISMWDLVLKNLLKQIQWCNRNLIWIFGLWAITFLVTWTRGTHCCILPPLSSPLTGMHGGACILYSQLILYVALAPLYLAYWHRIPEHLEDPLRVFRPVSDAGGCFTAPGADSLRTDRLTGVVYDIWH